MGHTRIPADDEIHGDNHIIKQDATEEKKLKITYMFSFSISNVENFIQLCSFILQIFSQTYKFLPFLAEMPVLNEQALTGIKGSLKLHYKGQTDRNEIFLLM